MHSLFCILYHVFTPIVGPPCEIQASSSTCVNMNTTPFNNQTFQLIKTLSTLCKQAKCWVSFD
jgi:hypothetical protein